jgi:hypothetical protein
MDNEQSAFNSSNHKHNKYLFFSGKKYYIEVIQCSGEEMNLVLMGLVPSNLLNIQRNPVSPRGNFILSLVFLLINFSFYFPGPLIAPVNGVVNFQPPNSMGYPVNPSLIPLNQSGPATTSPTNPGPTAIFSQQLPPMQMTNGSNPNAQINGSTSNMMSQNPNANGFYPQILYWYPTGNPTPPVSPSSAIYIHPSSMLHPATAFIIVLRGVPQNATVADIMHFLNGFPEVNLKKQL